MKPFFRMWKEEREGKNGWRHIFLIPQNTKGKRREGEKKKEKKERKGKAREKIMADSCSHLTKFKAEGGEKTLAILQKYKIQVTLGNLVAPRCTTCGTLTGRLFACLHCVHFACSDHLKSHYQHLNHSHPLGKSNNYSPNTFTSIYFQLSSLLSPQMPNWTNHFCIYSFGVIVFAHILYWMQQLHLRFWMGTEFVKVQAGKDRHCGGSGHFRWHRRWSRDLSINVQSLRLTRPQQQ